MDLMETRKKMQISSIRNALHCLFVEIAKKHIKGHRQTAKTAKNLRFRLHHTLRLSSISHTYTVIADAMREDANSHTSITLLTHPAFITLSVSFGLVIYTREFSHNVISD